METARQPVQPVKEINYQQKLAQAQEDILQLKIQLRDRNQALNDSLLTSNNLKKRMAQLLQQNKLLEAKNAQMFKEIQEKTKIIESGQIKPKEQPQKINFANSDEINQLQQQISQFVQKINSLQAKNSKLSQDLKNQSALSAQFQKKYIQETQKASHLMVVMEQVQQEFNNAKKFKDKTFQEEYNKLLSHSKKLQAKIREIKAENDRLKEGRDQNIEQQEQQKEVKRQNQAENEKELQKDQMKQKQKQPKQQIKVIQNPIVKNICTISLHYQQGLRLSDVERQLDQLRVKEETWENQTLALKNDLKTKEEEINMFHWQVYQLQKNVSELKTSQASVKRSLELANKKLEAFVRNNNNHHPVPNKSQSFKQIPNQEVEDLTPQTKPIFQTPVPNAVQYVKRIANTIGFYWTDIYYELDGQYILDHSNIPIDIDEFLVYDWTRLKQVNFYNTEFDIEKWTRFAQNAKKFPRLDQVYLHGNPLRFVKQQDLSKFKKLKGVIFKYTDQTRGN